MSIKTIDIVEIGPRDGFQNVIDFIATDFKIAIIEGLIAAGLKKIEITSFVSEKTIAQMKDAEIVSRTLFEKYPDMRFFALVPNFIGAQKAVACGYQEITPVISLSQTHNLKNVRKTQAASIEEIKKIRNEFPEIKIIQDIATVFGCPFEGPMAVAPLLELLGLLIELGIEEFTLCDTIGVAYPKQIHQVIEQVNRTFPSVLINIHIHDTRNMGILNTYLSILQGVNSVQTSIGGLGGCPFAPGASGNTATEDLVYLLHAEGIETGIDFARLLMTAKQLYQHVKGNYSGHHIHIMAKQNNFS